MFEVVFGGGCAQTKAQSDVARWHSDTSLGMAHSCESTGSFDLPYQYDQTTLKNINGDEIQAHNQPKATAMVTGGHLLIVHDNCAHHPSWHQPNSTSTTDSLTSKIH